MPKHSKSIWIFNHFNQQSIKVPLLERNVSPAGNTPQPNIDLALIPAKLRPKAENLVSLIKDNTEGRAYLERQCYSWFALDIFTNTIQPYRCGEPPTGHESFMETLRRSNLPLALVGNKRRYYDFISSLESSQQQTPADVVTTPRRRNRRDTPRLASKFQWHELS